MKKKENVIRMHMKGYFLWLAHSHCARFHQRNVRVVSVMFGIWYYIIDIIIIMQNTYKTERTQIKGIYLMFDKCFSFLWCQPFDSPADVAFGKIKCNSKLSPFLEHPWYMWDLFFHFITDICQYQLIYIIK